MKKQVGRNVLCVDPGFVNTGAAVYDCTLHRFVSFHHVETAPLAKKHNIYVADDNMRRCSEIASAFDDWIGRYHVSAVFAELPTGGARNAKAAMAMSMSAAVVSSVCAVRKASLYPIQPMEAKKIAKDCGGSKEDVQKMVIKRYVEPHPALWQLFLPKMRGWEHIADAMALIEVVKRKYGHLLLNEV